MRLTTWRLQTPIEIFGALRLMMRFYAAAYRYSSVINDQAYGFAAEASVHSE